VRSVAVERLRSQCPTLCDTLRESGKVSFTDAFSRSGIDIRPLPFCTVLSIHSQQIAATQDVGKQAAALQKQLDLTGHLTFLQVIKELCNPLPLRLADGLKNAGLGRTIEIGTSAAATDYA